MMDWAVLGLVYDAGKAGIRITDLAVRLDTTKAFVTNHVNLLEAKHFVTRTTDTSDTRAKVVRINPRARKKVMDIEKTLRTDMRRNLYDTIQPKDLEVYVKVLEQIASL